VALPMMPSCFICCSQLREVERTSVVVYFTSALLRMIEVMVIFLQIAVVMPGVVIIRA